MIALGINKGSTSYSKKLKDGGAALISDCGIISSISEERVSRIKADGGFKASVDYLLKKCDISIDKVDIVVYSSCCEYNPNLENKSKFLSNKLVIPVLSHHFSHACSSYLLSGFDEAITVIMDSGGDLLEDMTQGNEWWRYKREQNSYYLCSQKEIKLIGRDFSNPYESGIGEIFRAFTRFLGWDVKYTGKLMSLSGLTESNSFDHQNIYSMTEDGNLKSYIVNNPFYPEMMVKEFGNSHHLNFGNPRKLEDKIKDIHIDIAHYIQSQYEKFIIKKISYLISKYKVKNICLAGGVGLNCLGNSKIKQNTQAEKLFVQPASGDQGQCLGNALYGIYNLKKQWSRFNLPHVFLGPKVEMNFQNIDNIITNKVYDFDRIKLHHPEKAIANLIYNGYIIAHFYGESEFGPRTLGNRSILADPRDKSIKNKLNNIKKREYFNPFATSILEEYYSVFFHNSQHESPFMLFADKIKEEKKKFIPGVLHADGTSRIQTVNKKISNRYYNIIHEFYNLSQIPLILNTSLNAKDEPICETLEDALHTFDNIDIDGIVIDDNIVFKKSNKKIYNYLTMGNWFVVEK